MKIRREPQRGGVATRRSVVVKIQEHSVLGEGSKGNCTKDFVGQYGCVRGYVVGHRHPDDVHRLIADIAHGVHSLVSHDIAISQGSGWILSDAGIAQSQITRAVLL